MKTTTLDEKWLDRLLESDIHPQDYSWLETHTGKSKAWWLHFVEEQITVASTSARTFATVQGTRHSYTDATVWTKAVVEAVIYFVRMRITENTDANIRIASVTSQVLALWSMRVSYAKAHDDLRPQADRQKALRMMHDYAKEFVDLALDPRADYETFPNQLWDDPFGVKSA